ncbi:MAG TPA: HAD hydrolase-like protein [Rickettsiales bacterium]|nr:HAD hydrolase-like protein [Rickettsiales bacterium]
MEKLNNILDLKDRFDIFIFDAYGVFWDGSDFYMGSREAMAELVNNGKIVYILSNTTQLSQDAEKKYEEKGLIKGTHYSEIVTSGDATKEALINDDIHFIKNPNGRKVYQFGTPNKKLFEGTDYIMVNTLEEAELIYISVPQFIEEEYDSLKEKYGKYLFEAKPKEGQPRRWNSIILEPFAEKIKILLQSKLPVLNANPDYVALEGVKDSDKKIFMIRQGAIAEALRNLGSEVIEYGKPDKEIFDFAFHVLSQNDISTKNKSRICMIGDTLRTDIKGANNAGIVSVLCVETGVIADEIKKGNKLEDLIIKADVTVDYTIKTIGK